MKEKNGLKRFFASLLVVVLLLTSAPLAGFAELDLYCVANWFSTVAKAATNYTEDYLKHETENGKAIITGYNGSLSGELVIPETRTVATIRHTYVDTVIVQPAQRMVTQRTPATFAEKATRTALCKCGVSHY